MRQYYQNKCDVEEYIDEFEELVDISQYKDSLAIVLKFCHGLNATIQDKITKLGSNCPSNDEPDQQYMRAQLLDQNCIANEAFQTAQNKLQAPSTGANNLQSVFLQTLVSVRGTPRFLPFLFYSWSLRVIIYSNLADILLFHISLLIFSVVLLIFLAYSHIIPTALALPFLFSQQISEVILPASIFQHFDIISH
jgi:hypothetical protein